MKTDLQPAFYVPKNDQAGSARNKNKLSSKPLLSTRFLLRSEQNGDRRFIRKVKILYFYLPVKQIGKIGPSFSFLLGWEAKVLSHGSKSLRLCFPIQSWCWCFSSEEQAVCLLFQLHCWTSSNVEAVTNKGGRQEVRRFVVC